MNFADQFAPEAAAEAAFDLKQDAPTLAALEAAEAVYFPALTAAKAEFGKIADALTRDQVASAEENALDTLAENRIDPSSVVGRIAFPSLATASFSFPEELIDAPRETFGPFERLTVDDLIKARTKVWRDSWIVDPLEDLIARLEAKPEGKGAKS